MVVELQFCSVMLYRQHIMTILLLQLPGVDPNDPSVKDLLASLQGQSEVCLYEPSVFVLLVYINYLLHLLEIYILWGG